MLGNATPREARVEKRNLAIFFFAGCFSTMTDGCHVRACQDIEMLLALGWRVAVYSYRNHHQWPWNAKGIETFRARFPGVDLVLDDWNWKLAFIQKLKGLIAYLGSWPATRALRTWLPMLTPEFDRLQRDPDLKLALVSYPWGISHLNGSPGPRMIVDTHDLAALELIGDNPSGQPDTRSMLVLKRELFYLGQADEIWSISYSEGQFLKSLLEGERVRIVPPSLRSWNVAAATDVPPVYDLVFVGSNNRWNGDAISGFLSAYGGWNLPLKIAIAGSVCRDRRLSAQNGVELLGFVDDLAALYAQARAAICPVEGTGTKIKLIEALSAGRPVFAAPGALKGLLPGYENCVLPLERRTVATLLGDPAALAAAQAAARHYARAYSFDRVVAETSEGLAGDPALAGASPSIPAISSR